MTKAAEAMINSDPFCAVRLQQIENSRGDKTDKFMIELQEPAPDYKEEQLEEHNLVPSEPGFREIPGVGVVHSADYKLVTNQQVHDMALQVIDDTGMTFEPVPSFGAGHSQPLFWNGRRYSEKWFCKDTSVGVPGGSQMMLGIEIANSYDGSCKVGLAFFAMHLVCSNQFYSGNMLGRPFEFPHVNRGGELDEDIGVAMRKIQEKSRDFAKIVPNMKTLQDTRVRNVGDFLDMRNRLKAGTGTEFRDKQLLDELSGNGITNQLNMRDVTYDDPSTYWNIANAYTAITTHAVGGPRGANQSARVVDWLLRDAIEKQN